MRFSAAILCSYISNYGIEIIPNFFTNIIQMMQNPETIEASFYTLEEYSQGSLKIPKEILQILLNFISAENKYHYNVLSIFNNVINDNINFIHQNVIPLILNFYKFYEIKSLAKCATIAASTFVHFHDTVIGDFIANCLVFSPSSNESNIIEDQLVSTLFDKEEWIHPYPPIIYALITKLGNQDDDISNYGICSMSQIILMSLFVRNPDIIEPIIIESISKFQLTNNPNNGFVFRCLSIIINDQNIAEKFFPFVFKEISSRGISRGEAALCLSRYCQFHTDSNDIINKSISVILPLLGDVSDSKVQYQSIISIQNIIENLNQSYQPNVEHLVFLIKMMKTPGLQLNMVILADLIVSFMNFFTKFGDFNENSFFASFFKEVVEFFLRENESNPLFTSFTEILSAFVGKISNIDSLFSSIINKILFVLNENNNQDENQSNTMCVYDSYDEEKYSCLALLNSILIINQKIDSYQLSQIINELIKIIKLQGQNQLIICQAFEISLILYQMNIQLLQSDQLTIFYLEACSNYLSTKNPNISYIVAQILPFLIHKMSFQQMQVLLKKCCFFINLYGDRSSPVFTIGHRLYHILSENNQIINDFMIETFEHACSHCSCNHNNS